MTLKISSISILVSLGWFIYSFFKILMSVQIFEGSLLSILHLLFNVDHCKNFFIFREGSLANGAGNWFQITRCPDGVHSACASFPILRCLVFLRRLFQCWLVVVVFDGVLPKQLLNKCMKVLCFQFTVKFKYSILDTTLTEWET